MFGHTHHIIKDGLSLQMSPPKFTAPSVDTSWGGVVVVVILT